MTVLRAELAKQPVRSLIEDLYAPWRVGSTLYTHLADLHTQVVQGEDDIDMG